MKTPLRIGQGFDVHAFAAGRRCILCGVDIPAPQGLLGHSDADVALHALSDALLGALSLGDIGKHFPDTDPRYAGANSRVLLRHVMELVHNAGYHVLNADITIIAQTPKMAPYIDAMRTNVAADLDTDVENISVKATTTEHLGFTGRREGIAAMAICLLALS